MVVGFGNSPLKNGRKDQPSLKDQLVREVWRFLFFCMQNQVSKFLKFRVLIDLGKMKMLETDVYHHPVSCMSYWYHLHIHACFDIYLPSYMPIIYMYIILYTIIYLNIPSYSRFALEASNIYIIYISISTKLELRADVETYHLPQMLYKALGFVALPHEIPWPRWSFPCLKAIVPETISASLHYWT